LNARLDSASELFSSVLQQSLKSVVSKLGSMEGSRGETTQRRGERCWSQRRERAEFPALNGFRQKRSAGNRGRAAATEEAHLTDGRVLDDGSELKDIAANRITDFHPHVRTGQFPGIAWMLEVLKQSFVEHATKYRSGNGGVSRDRTAGTSVVRHGPLWAVRKGGSERAAQVFVRGWAEENAETGCACDGGRLRGGMPPFSRRARRQRG